MIKIFTAARILKTENLKNIEKSKILIFLKNTPQP